jgi:hypothetical protein
MRIRSACLGAVAFWIAPMTAWALCKGTPPIVTNLRRWSGPNSNTFVAHILAECGMSGDFPINAPR